MFSICNGMQEIFGFQFSPRDFVPPFFVPIFDNTPVFENRDVFFNFLIEIGELAKHIQLMSETFL